MKFVRWKGSLSGSPSSRFPSSMHFMRKVGADLHGLVYVTGAVEQPVEEGDDGRVGASEIDGRADDEAVCLLK